MYQLTSSSRIMAYGGGNHAFKLCCNTVLYKFFVPKSARVDSGSWRHRPPWSILHTWNGFIDLLGCSSIVALKSKNCDARLEIFASVSVLTSSGLMPLEKHPICKPDRKIECPSIAFKVCDAAFLFNVTLVIGLKLRVASWISLTVLLLANTSRFWFVCCSALPAYTTLCTRESLR